MIFQKRIGKEMHKICKCFRKSFPWFEGPRDQSSRLAYQGWLIPRRVICESEVEVLWFLEDQKTLGEGL